MANIDPQRIAGQPLIAFVPEFPGSFLLLKPAAYDYVVNELKQDLNTPLPRYYRTIFASFCLTLSDYDDLRAGKLEEFWQQSIQRINTALDRGARSTPLPNIPPHSEPAQPLPMCMKAYLALRHIPARAEAMLALIQRLIKGGANPNAAAFGVPLLARAVESMDAPLLNELVAGGANINATYPAQPEGVCSLPARVTNSVLAYMPDPEDRAIEPARQFLIAYMKHGGKLTAPRHSSRFSAHECITTAKTLKQRALDRGQVAYAQMVDALEETQANIPPPKVAAIAKAKPAPSATSPLRLTGSLNPRQSPSTTAPLARKLNPGDTLSLEGAPRDGWSAARLADGTTVWVNLAALAKNAAADTATAAPSGPPPSPQDTETAHLQAIAIVLQGAADIEPHTTNTIVRNSFGTPAWEYRQTTTIMTETPCSFRVVTERAKRDFDAQKGTWGPWHSGSPFNKSPTSRYEQRVDFGKATAIKIERMEDPEEGLMRSFVNRPGNHHPPMLTRISFKGVGAVCPLGKRNDGSDMVCSPNEDSGAYRDTREPAAMAQRAKQAFATIKRRCP
ncbi:SH3 domain-containing protein [Hyphomicrobium sp. CS1BSMeth3]|uniref:SH3 domain-containing protein n=1 Tax=Hyphomicrobium sp. CS1BSMeth3 TaxID=1892844 RepID=UPI0011606C74|nr:SH3 domain-containing protein [Hyphomicrobium sp. CS1BSMeth3]